MGADRFSVELCGGTHVARTGDIGLFWITAESGVASGVRRIEAVTGEAALAYVAALSQEMQAVCGVLKATPDSASAKVEFLSILENLAVDPAAASAKSASNSSFAQPNSFQASPDL